MQRRKDHGAREGEGGGGRGPQAEVSYGRRRPQADAAEVSSEAPKAEPAN